MKKPNWFLFSTESRFEFVCILMKGTEMLLDCAVIFTFKYSLALRYTVGHGVVGTCP